MFAVIFALCFSCVLWWVLGVATVSNILSLRQLGDLPLPERRQWPSLAVIAPACDEALHLKEATARRLQLDYPELSILIIDDRSTDDTGAIAAAMAASDERIEVIHNRELPEGWLGKVHALALGVEAAECEWILFSDADVFIAPTALKRAINHCDTHGFEMLAAMPTLYPAGFVMNALHATFLRVLFAAFWRRGVENPRSSYGVGVGAFTLVKRKHLVEHEILKSIRMEVADDLMLGRQLKAHGVRCTIVNGAALLAVDIYPKPRDFILGAEKNAWAVSAQFSLSRGMLGALSFGVFELAPMLLCLPLFPLWAQLFGAATLLWAIGVSTLALKANGRSPWGGLYFPVGSALFLYAMIRGTWLGWRNGGLQWRGTFYPTSAFVQARKNSSKAAPGRLDEEK